MSYGQAVQWMPGMTLEQMEKSIIEAAYRWYRQNKTQTAAALGISIRTLDNKLEKYDADKRADDDAFEQRKRNDAETLARFRNKGITDRFATGGSAQWAVEPDAERDAAVARAGVDKRGQENPSEDAKENGESGSKASAGVRVQPTAEARTEPTMSVSQRKEVQSVLPRQTSTVRHGRNR